MKIIIRKNHVKLQLRHIKVKIVGLIIQQKIRKEIEFIQMEHGEIILLLVMLKRLKEWLSLYPGIHGPKTIGPGPNGPVRHRITILMSLYRVFINSKVERREFLSLLTIPVRDQNELFMNHE